MAVMSEHSTLTPTILPLGDSALLVRFGTELSDAANRAAIGLAVWLEERMPVGALEVVPNLTSVLVRYDPAVTSFGALAGEVRLLVSARPDRLAESRRWSLSVRFDGEDLEAVATSLGFDRQGFVEAHNAVPLRVLATGFAPGFVYCGLHGAGLVTPRRSIVRQHVPAGSVLFAAGQTAIAATDIPTGWHLIGHTDFRNFDPSRTEPTRMRAGDLVQFEALA